MAEIRLRDIEKNFGDNYVIRRLNLTIANKEFVVLLDDCVTSAALAIGERLRLAVIDEAIPHLNRPDGREIVTVSLGIAVSGDGGEVIYDMVNRADTALYEAKRQGRDRLVLASGPTEAIAGPTGPYDAEAAMSA